MQFGNMPSDMDITVLYNGAYAAALMEDGGEGWCRKSQLSATQSNDLNILTSSMSDFEKQEHPDIIEEEEASLPSL